MTLLDPRPDRPQPPSTPDSEPFWEATRERRLKLQWCLSCNRVVHFPRSLCPHCGGRDLQWREAPGTGTVYSFTVDHRPPPPFGPDPWVVALVELDEGARLMTNISGCSADQVRIGMPVEVAWEPLPDGRHLPIFQPRN